MFVVWKIEGSRPVAAAVEQPHWTLGDFCDTSVQSCLTPSDSRNRSRSDNVTDCDGLIYRSDGHIGWKAHISTATMTIRNLKSGTLFIVLVYTGN